MILVRAFFSGHFFAPGLGRQDNKARQAAVLSEKKNRSRQTTAKGNTTMRMGRGVMVLCEYMCGFNEKRPHIAGVIPFGERVKKKGTSKGTKKKSSSKPRLLSLPFCALFSFSYVTFRGGGK